MPITNIFTSCYRTTPHRYLEPAYTIRRITFCRGNRGHWYNLSAQRYAQVVKWLESIGAEPYNDGLGVAMRVIRE